MFKKLSEDEKTSFARSKKDLTLLLSLFLIMLVLFFGAKFINEIKGSEFVGRSLVQTNTISVIGTGEVFVKPDIAKITLSVVREADTALEAQKQSAEAVNAVIQFLNESGIEDKDIKTTNYNLWPVYDYLQDRGRVLRGYEASQNLEVKIRKIEDTGKILAGATEAGANQVSGLSFTIDDEEQLKKDARKIAIAKAKVKARELAGELNITLGRLVDFSESGGAAPPIPIFYEGAGKGGDLAVAQETPTGENKVAMTVSLTFEIK